MHVTAEYWYLLPTAIAIATVAMASGIGGAVFFAPLFILVLQLDPAVAIGAALMTELFGFSSGLYAYLRRRLIDFRIGAMLLMFSVPAAIVGTLSAGLFPAVALKSIFAVGIIFIGLQLYLSYRKGQIEKIDADIADAAATAYERELTARDGAVYRYSISEKNLGRVFATVGGAFIGMISVGLGELTEYLLVARCRVPSPVAVGTSVFLVVVTVLVASVGHFWHFATAAEPEVLNSVLSIVIFTAPGVVIGGQFGPLVQARANPDVMKVVISFLFVAVGVLMLATITG